MKVSNETKVGALTAISITLLILGFNYLKGKNILSKANPEIHTVFNRVEGLMISTPVTINGLQVGKVSDIKEKSANLGDGIVVTINLNKDINIPTNSFTSVKSSPLGDATVTITLGTTPEFVKNGDTLLAKNAIGLMDEVKATLNPALANVNGTLRSLDSLLEVVGTYFDPGTKNNFHKIVANLTKSSTDLQVLMDAQNSALSKSLNNVNTITGNLANNNDKINATLANVEKATGKLANAKLEETISSLQTTITQLNGLVAKANSKDGSVGLLLNDTKLYKNLESTTYKLNILLDDFRTHPKRYVNVSVFGKKDKSSPLAAPLQDDSTQVPLQQKKK
ncbi:MAG: MCE family protein [Sphingobacteriales bacterium]|jgi:phospholipid/cholesterol/gamma-HCH transport system substrate-binding protein|nr:MAG: MCE family protein [Sphingobacteriales bacterium]